MYEKNKNIIRSNPTKNQRRYEGAQKSQLRQAVIAEPSVQNQTVND
jgi:hypothetical protein